MIDQSAIGMTFCVDAVECTGQLPVDEPSLHALTFELAEAIGATVLGHHYEAFSPHGSTYIAVLSTSHVAIHIWPEHGYVAVDVFSCSATGTLDDIERTLRRHLAPGRLISTVNARGVGLR